VVNESVFPPERVTVMGVLNLTPDSFSDGGRFVAPGETPGAPRIAAVVEAARALVAAGAHLLDVGGESTRPGAVPVSLDEEIARTAPVVEALAARLDVPISIDTRNASVARAAVTAGASLINDVSGLSHDPAIADVAAESGAVLILGHCRGTPRSMQHAPHYEDFLAEVAAELQASIARAGSAGVASAQLVVDPGIGFGKRLEDNLQLLAHAGWLRDRLGLPLLLGPSRKSFLGKITGDPVEEREVATYAACAIAAASGADGVRVHDAGGARRAVAVGRAVRDARRKELT
jgi:dihydropteroate synthase